MVCNVDLRQVVSAIITQRCVLGPAAIDDFSPSQLWRFVMLLLFSRAPGVVLVLFECDSGVME